MWYANLGVYPPTIAIFFCLVHTVTGKDWPTKVNKVRNSGRNGRIFAVCTRQKVQGVYLYPAVSTRISNFVDLCWLILSVSVAVWFGLKLNPGIESGYFRAVDGVEGSHIWTFPPNISRTSDRSEFGRSAFERAPRDVANACTWVLVWLQTSGCQATGRIQAGVLGRWNVKIA